MLLPELIDIVKNYLYGDIESHKRKMRSIRHELRLARIQFLIRKVRRYRLAVLAMHAVNQIL